MPKIVTLDLECFYSTEYSLTKIPTEEYVRSPQFEMIGIAIKVDDGQTVWYPKPQVERILKEFDWSDAMVVAEHCVRWCRSQLAVWRKAYGLV